MGLPGSALGSAHLLQVCGWGWGWGPGALCPLPFCSEPGTEQPASGVWLGAGDPAPELLRLAEKPRALSWAKSATVSSPCLENLQAHVSPVKGVGLIQGGKLCFTSGRWGWGKGEVHVD